VETTRPDAPAPSGAEQHTRHAVARVLLEDGPVTATDVADRLGVSPAGVRRHLEALHAAAEATSAVAPVRGPRGRGRPARGWMLTAAGRSRFGHAYDDLAVAALRQLRELGGEAAVEEFARRRVAAVTAGIEPAGPRRSDRQRVADHLARALTGAGYAASTRQVGTGVQLCQHHCPVAHVAAEFPQLCEAERTAFADLLGTHVQRLATIANGDPVCTTHVPDGPAPPGPPGTARTPRRSTQKTSPTSTTPHHPVRNALRKELA
jgi:predicted ArsR family transcriptional regulator